MSSWSRQSKIRFAPGYRRVQRAPQITAATRDLRRFRSVEHRYGDAAHTGDGSSSVLTDPRRRSGTALAHVAETDKAIATLRLAVKDMYSRTETPAEAWPDDDQDAVDPRKGGFANATVLHAGATRETELRIC
jgi:hypothetical protein